jgi:hypothetical protein
MEAALSLVKPSGKYLNVLVKKQHIQAYILAKYANIRLWLTIDFDEQCSKRRRILGMFKIR